MRASIAGRRVAHWATREQRLIHPRRPSRDAHIAALRAIAHLHAFDVALKPSRCRMSAGFTAYLSSSLMSVVQRRSSPRAARKRFVERGRGLAQDERERGVEYGSAINHYYYCHYC